MLKKKKLKKSYFSVLENIANSKPMAKTALDFLRVVPSGSTSPPSTPQLQSKTPSRNSIVVFEKGDLFSQFDV